MDFREVCREAAGKNSVNSNNFEEDGTALCCTTATWTGFYLVWLLLAVGSDTDSTLIRNSPFSALLTLPAPFFAVLVSFLEPDSSSQQTSG